MLIDWLISLFILLLINDTLSLRQYNDRVDVVYSIDENKYFILINGYYKLIDNLFAIQIITNNPISIQSSKQLDIAYKYGGIFPLNINNNVSNPLKIVESIIQFIEDVSEGNNHLLYDIKTIQHKSNEIRFNTAILPIDNIYLAVDRNYFFWLDNNFNYNIKLNDIRQQLTLYKKEEDHRLLLLSNGDILTTFTALLPKINHKVGIRYIRKKTITNNMTIFNDVSDSIILLTKDDNPNHMEKNYMPFNYNNEVYFVTHYKPFKVYRIDTSASIQPTNYTYKDISFNIFRLSIVSDIYCIQFGWTYGYIRGGTPPLLVRGQYLAFFHTKSKAKLLFPDITTDARLYFNGAYTFTQTIPFRMLKMTRSPISSDQFRPYDNPRILNIDYVTYFMSSFLVDKYNHVIFEGEEEKDPSTTAVALSIGVNDHESVIAKINLNKLLDSMIDIDCKA